MSAVIRLQLVTVLATLKEKGRAVLTALNVVHPTLEENDRLQMEAIQLREAAGRAQALIDKWSVMIGGLLPTLQQEELDLLQAFPPPQGEERADDEPTVLAQIERSYELVDLVDACLGQRRAQHRGSGSISSQRSEKSATVVKEQDQNVHQRKQPPMVNEQGSQSPEHPAMFTRRLNQGQANDQQAGNCASAHQTHSASQAGFSPYQQQGMYNGAPIFSTFRPFRLEPMKFSGDPKEWTAFWMAFDRAVNSQPIPAFEKHLCLLQSLVPGSAAKRAIDGYPPSDDSYPMVVSILRRQFGDGKALREGLIAELLHLQVANNSLSSLRNLREHVERICLQLESPEGSNSTQDEIVCGIIRSKLPREALETLIGWEQDETEWTLAHLRTGLGRIVQRKERLERTITNLRPTVPERRRYEDEPRQRSLPQERSVQHRPAQVSRSFVAVQPAVNHNEARTRTSLPPLSSTSNGCSLCNVGPEHYPSRCSTWNTPQKRQSRLLEQHRCLNCLRDDHTLNQCPSPKKCRTCGGRHHFIVCVRQRLIERGESRNVRQPAVTMNNGRPTGANSQPLGQLVRNIPALNQLPVSHTGMATESTVSDKESSEGLQSTDRQRALLMVTEVIVRPPGANNRQVNAVVFFDPGSQTSFISGSLVRKLGLKSGHSEKMRVHVLGGERSEPLCFDSARYKLQLKRSDGQWERIELNYIEEIAAQMETPKYLVNHCMDTSILRMDTGKPDILIGTRQFWNYFINSKTTEHGYAIIWTTLGVVLGGEANLPERTGTSSSLMAINPVNQEQMPTATAIEEFWALETIGIKDDPAQDDDQLAEKMVDQSIRQLEDGRYCVRWPWRDPCPELPSNFSMAFRRLVSTLNRMRNEPEQLQKYNHVINEQLQQGIIELTGCSPGTLEHYLPHHAVITPKKLRVVYDASAHPKGQACLNDCLYRGPVLLPDLAGVLLRFRNCFIPVLADVEKAFLMIELEPEDREVCKFLWAKNPMQQPTGDNLAVYRFCRVAFGVVSSPFMLAAVIRAHLAKFGHDQDAVQFRNVYVDNLLIECENEAEARLKAIAAKELFKQAKMNLREYITHSPNVMTVIPKEDRLDQVKAKVLGVNWDTQTDEIFFEFPTTKSTSPITRRTVLSVLAGIFDPLGLIGPCTLEAKKFFQKLWDESHGWDNELSNVEAEQWKSICNKWSGATIRQERYILSKSNGLQLHVFTDASETSYAAAVYLRSDSRTRLVFSKVRLKPRKARETMTIPRMELMGVLLGVRATVFASAQIHRPITATHLWCDSQIVLAWIRSKETQPVFVENRLREIRKQVDTTFHYVSTTTNPADLATRGTTPAQLMEANIWWDGPTWINDYPNQWPQEIEFKLAIDCENPPEDLLNEPFVGVVKEVSLNQIFNVTRFSSLLTLLGTVILVLRFIKTRCLQFPSCISTTGKFNARDYRIARSLLIRMAQQEHRQELTSKYIAIDSEGIIRLQTRIDKNTGPDAPSNPIWLPRHSSLTPLIIMDVHQRLKHAGVDWTLTELLREFYLSQARRTTKKVLSLCTRCRLMNKPKYALPVMPPLPADRVQRRRPFESVGLDYLGPTLARQAGVVVKVWIVIITCLSVRAVYLEPTYDLSAASFINVLRRFISRRGKPKRILSDNAPTFVITGKALRTFSTNDDPSDFSARSGIDWHFIPQLSPWAGGLYERLVALVKHSIQRTLGRRILPCDELSAFLTEAEASINSRPLTTVSDAEGAPIPLRPMDFLIPGADVHLATTELEDDDDQHLPSHEKLANLWCGTQEAIEYCWTRWTKEYLLVLRERAGWTHHGPRSQVKSIPAVGDVVLIEEDLRPRNLWSLGRITELNGYEPNIRSAQVLMINGKVLTRPINRLCPLESNAIIEKDIPTQEPDDLPETATITNKPVKSGNKKLIKQVPPTSPARHNMITRARAKMGAVALMVFMAIICPLVETSITNRVICTLKGIIVTSPYNIQKTEICCMGSCWSRAATDRFVFELPMEMLVNDYTCIGHFWYSSENSTVIEQTCPAVDECLLIECILCWDLITNPTCRPQTAMIVIGLLMALLLSLFGVIWTCFRRMTKGVRLVCQILAWITAGPALVFHWFNGHERFGTIRESPETKLFSGIKVVKKNMRSAQNRLQRFRDQRMRRFDWMLAVLALSLLITGVLAGSETVSIVTKSESCLRSVHGLVCTIRSATTLTLLPAGQTSNLLLKDEHGLALGVLSATFHSIRMECLQKSEAWLRSYEVKVSSIKRCPTAGSCRGNYCADIRTDSLIPELKEVNIFPGKSFCVDSSSFWQNQCGLPASACLYYRWYARTTSRRLFEVVSCPAWDVTFPVGLRLELTGGKLWSTELVLRPGMTSNWGNISITPLSVSLPPMPTLSNRFITNGRTTALIQHVPTNLHCADEVAARKFNCSLDIDTCKDCKPNHEDGSVSCHCQDVDVEGILENPMARLPITVAKVYLYNEGPAIYAEQSYSPVQLHVQMKDLQLILEFRDSKCWIEPISLVGCYKCPTGAQLRYKCRTDWGTALAKVECDDGTVFATQCTTNSTDKMIILPFDRSLIKINCVTDCPAGETSFNLSAELHYIPLKRQFGHKQRLSDRLETEPEGAWQWPMDFGFDPFAIVRLWASLPLLFMCVFALVIGLFMLYLAIKFSPVYRAYKLAAWLFLQQGHRPDNPTKFATAMLILIVITGGLAQESHVQHKKLKFSSSDNKSGNTPSDGMLMFSYFVLVALFILNLVMAILRECTRLRERRAQHRRDFLASTIVITGILFCVPCLAAALNNIVSSDGITAAAIFNRYTSFLTAEKILCTTRAGITAAAIEASFFTTAPILCVFRAGITAAVGCEMKEITSFMEQNYAILVDEKYRSKRKEHGKIFIFGESRNQPNIRQLIYINGKNKYLHFFESINGNFEMLSAESIINHLPIFSFEQIGLASVCSNFVKSEKLSCENVPFGWAIDTADGFSDKSTLEMFKMCALAMYKEKGVAFDLSINTGEIKWTNFLSFKMAIDLVDSVAPAMQLAMTSFVLKCYPAKVFWCQMCLSPPTYCIAFSLYNRIGQVNYKILQSLTMEPSPIKETTQISAATTNKPGKCSSCFSKGLPLPHGHRACDKACPYFKEWRQQQKLKATPKEAVIMQQQISEEQVLAEEEEAVANLRLNEQQQVGGEQQPAGKFQEEGELKKMVMSEAAKLIANAPGCDPLEELECVDADLSQNINGDQQGQAKWALDRLRKRLAAKTEGKAVVEEGELLEEEGLIRGDDIAGAQDKTEQQQQERRRNEEQRSKSYAERKRGFRDAKTQPSQLAMAAIEGNRKLNEEKAALARDPERAIAAKTAHRAAVRVLRLRGETTDAETKEKRLKAIEEGPGWRHRTFSKLPDKGGLKEHDPTTTQILRKEKAAALRTADVYLKRAEKDREDLAPLKPEKRPTKESKSPSRPRTSRSSSKRRRRESPVVARRPSPKDQKRGSGERARHHRHHYKGQRNASTTTDDLVVVKEVKPPARAIKLSLVRGSSINIVPGLADPTTLLLNAGATTRQTAIQLLTGTALHLAQHLPGESIWPVNEEGR